jgi:hypothetical protein
MKPLTSYKKNGYQFKLVKREGPFAIFLGTKDGSASQNYEVIRVRLVLAGSRILTNPKPGSDPQIHWEAHEAPPGDHEWGVRGWTCCGILDAEAKLDSLLQQEKQRYARQTND